MHSNLHCLSDIFIKRCINTTNMVKWFTQHKGNFQTVLFYLVSIKSPNRPFGSFQIIVGLLELSDVFVKLLLDAARLAEVVLQHGDLLVALRVLLLQLLLRRRADNMYWTSDCMHLNTWLNSSQSTPPYIFQCSIHFPFPFKKKKQHCDPFIHQLWDNWHDKHHRACLRVWPTSADKVMTELQPVTERPDSPLVQQVQLTEFKSTNAEINLKLWFVQQSTCTNTAREYYSQIRK